MPVPIWNENSKSYLQEEKTDPKDRIDVIIGDDKDPSVFHPQFKLQRWDNEANVSFRLDHSWLPGTKVTNDELNGVITWTKKVGQNEWIARFYEDWGTPEGAYKFVELVLPAKPPTNQISFTTQSKDVDFFYQPQIELGNNEIFRADLTSTVEQLNPSSLVDIGGGTGEFALLFNGLCVDPSTEAYSLRVTENYLQENILNGLSLSDNSYDLATGIGLLKYISEDDAQQFIQEVVRISSRGLFTTGYGFRTFSDAPPIVNNNNAQWWIDKFNQYVPDFQVDIYDLSQEIKRDDEVAGSYAIYHKTRGGMNDVRGKEYKTGKIGHLYRAKLIDANGNELWADYNTDLNETGILTITADQTWLDNAVYPVIVDPTFGYTSQGASSTDLGSEFYGATTDKIVVSLHSVAESFTPDSISFYISANTNSSPTKATLYDGSGNLISDTISASSATSGTGWITRTISGASSKSSATYGVSVMSDASGLGAYASDPILRYDDGGANTGVKVNASSPYTFNNSITINSTMKGSIYATYTPTTNNYPTVIGSITTGTSGSGTSHTVTSGTDALIVTIGTHQGSISNVQWDGNALTLAVDADTAFNENAEIWYLNSPTAGTGNITYSSTGSHKGWAAINVSGCDTIDGTTTTSEEASTDGDLSITTPAAQCLVIDAIYSEANVTNNNPDTTTAADLQGASYENFGSQYVTVPPSSTKDMRWSLSSSQRTAHVAIALEGVAAATATRRYSLTTLSVG